MNKNIERLEKLKEAALDAGKLGVVYRQSAAIIEQDQKETCYACLAGLALILKHGIHYPGKEIEELEVRSQPNLYDMIIEAAKFLGLDHEEHTDIALFEGYPFGEEAEDITPEQAAEAVDAVINFDGLNPWSEVAR